MLIIKIVQIRLNILKKSKERARVDKKRFN